MLAIPPDITPQIARSVASRLKHKPLPHRISYSGRVLRHTEQQSGQNREIMQAGVELIGLDSPDADAEVVALAAEAMTTIGLQGFKIDLGQVAFCQGVFHASGLAGQALKQMQQAVALKDVSTVRELLKKNQVPQAIQSELLALPRLFGGCELLDEAADIVNNPESTKALQNIRKVVELLKLHGISDDCLTLDLGETRGLDYHTGLTFEGFMPGIGTALFSGGRYDDLIARYGPALPATGFTCNLLGLLQAIEMSSGGIVEPVGQDLLVVATAEQLVAALKITGSLRQRGYGVSREIIKRDLQQTVEYAAATHIKHLLVMEGNGKPDADSLCLIKVADQTRTDINSEQLWQLYPARG
jgi:ATP phosphoribosyltransferase regulatory subunit